MHPQNKGCMRAEEEGRYLQAKERAPEKPRWHLVFELPASKTVRKECLLFETPEVTKMGPHTEISVLIGRGRETRVLSLSLMHRHQGKATKETTVCKPGKEVSPETDHVSTLILTFYLPEP